MSITWNGVSSDTIGVIVERIPNRYVPTRRFSPQQVAGRNGNILLVDKSFPNVEQEYEVYLSAESQGLPSVARACAEWLMGPDGYCRLTDSYDTTVYREAFLMGGFDIENILNKFGRCTITFSCKPQKFLYTGLPSITIDPTGYNQTYTGEIVTFESAASDEITSLTVPFSPIQDLNGYSHPWPAGGGVNKFNIDAVGGTPDPTTGSNATSPRILEFGKFYKGLRSDNYYYPQYASYTISDGVLTVTNGSNNAYGAAYTVEVDGGEDVTVSGVSSDGFVSVGWYDSDWNYLSQTNVFAIPHTFTMHTDAKCAVFVFRAPANSTATFSNIQIEKGSTAHDWQPYENICPISGRTGLNVYVSPTTAQADATTYSVDWSTQAGTVYGGTVDVVTGLLTVTMVSVDLGTLTWQKGTGHKFYATTTGVVVYKPYTPQMLCDTYKFAGTRNASPWYGDENELTCYYVGTSIVRELYINDPAYTDVAEFKTAMSGVQLCYELATPITYQLTPQEVETLVGENNIWADTGEEITVEVAGPSTLDNPTPFDALPLLTVSGEGAITINDRTILIQEAVEDFEIDCESGESDDNSKIYCMEFPVLHGGQNLITCDSTITSLSLIPRWWTL